MMRAPRRFALGLICMCFGLVARPCPAQTTAPSWVGSWASAPQLVEPRNRPPEPGLTGSTLRQTVHLSAGGMQLCVHFSNAFGNAPLMIKSARVAISTGGDRINPSSDHALVFAGQPAVTVPTGALIFSDPLPFQVQPMSDLAVTITFGNVPSDLTGHPGSRCTSYLQAGISPSADAMPAAAKTDHWYVLSGIDVLAASAPASLVVLGDSITDGRGSGTNQNDRWPDDLERRFAAAGAALSHVGVLNQGIGGNRLLNDGLGPNALARFDRDIAAQAGARWLMVLEGINDIGTGPKTDTGPIASSIIAAYQQILARAHALHLQVYGATILPFDGSFYATPDRLSAWQTVNQWIRNSKQFDAVIDFDAALRDPQHPTHLQSAFDSGDHLHPNQAGYRQMAASIDLHLFDR